MKGTRSIPFTINQHDGGSRSRRLSRPRMRVLDLGERALRVERRYWLITESQPFGTEPMLLKSHGPEQGEEAETLAVFSYPEEAREFIVSDADSEAVHRRRVRETHPGELLSMLSSPLRNIERVALDPPPELALYCMAPSSAAEIRVDSADLSRRRLLDLVTLTRAQFVELALEKLYAEPGLTNGSQDDESR